MWRDEDEHSPERRPPLPVVVFALLLIILVGLLAGCAVKIGPDDDGRVFMRHPPGCGHSTSMWRLSTVHDNFDTDTARYVHSWSTWRNGVEEQIGEADATDAAPFPGAYYTIYLRFVRNKPISYMYAGLEPDTQYVDRVVYDVQTHQCRWRSSKHALSFALHEK